jgi:hypothetical protein
LRKFSNALDKLKKRVLQIVSYHAVKPENIGKEEKLAHFTSWVSCAAMLKGLEERRAGSKPQDGLVLWASDATCLNDPLEGSALISFAEKEHRRHSPSGQITSLGGFAHQHSEDFLRNRLDAALLAIRWKSLRQALLEIYRAPPSSATAWTVRKAPSPSKIFLVSFCNAGDRLDLWRFYGRDGTGICMVMPLIEAANALAGSADWKLFRVAYDDASMARAWTLLEGPLRETWRAAKKLRGSARLRAFDSIQSALSLAFHLYKHPEFSSEAEIRLMYLGPDNKSELKPDIANGKPTIETTSFFLNSGNCAVILGPKIEQPNIRHAALERDLEKLFPQNTPVVRSSNVPYQ